MNSAHQQAKSCGSEQKGESSPILFTCMQIPCHHLLYTFTSYLFFLFRVYAFVPSIMKKDQECFLTVVLPFTKSSLLNFLTFGTTVSGISNEF
jgi:hypothetical protein